MSKTYSHPVTSYYVNRVCKICNHKLKYSSGIITMKSHFISKHEKEWLQIRKHRFIGGKTPTKNHPVTKHFNKNQCLVCNYEFRVKPKLTTMKKHFIKNHREEWNTFVRMNEFQINSQKKTQNVTKEPSKKPTQVRLIKPKPKLTNISSEKKFNAVTKRSKQPDPIKKHDTTSTRYESYAYFNQYDMLKMYRCDTCYEVVQPELLDLHVKLGCKKRFWLVE